MLCSCHKQNYDHKEVKQHKRTQLHRPLYSLTPVIVNTLLHRWYERYTDCIITVLYIVCLGLRQDQMEEAEIIK